jgi:hypothetical protein
MKFTCDGVASLHRNGRGYRAVVETMLRWVEPFDGAGGTLLLSALAAGLRILLLGFDRTLADG